MSVPPLKAATDMPLETALYLKSGDEVIFAIHTSSAVPQTGMGVVLAHSGYNNFSAHRNGVWTSISRQLAHAGIPSLRFDYAGTGESSGAGFTFRLDGQPVADETAAMDALRASGCRQLLLVGSCFGAFPSVMVGAASEDVAGVILLAPTLVLPDTRRMATFWEGLHEAVNRQTLRTAATNRHYRRWLFARLVSLARTKVAVKLSRPTRHTPASPGAEPSAVVSPGRGLLMENELARLVMTGRQVEVVYGTNDDNLARVTADPDASRALRLLREQRPRGLAWTVLEGSVHGLEDIAVQEQLIELVVGRACEVASRGLTSR
jgi:alpha/beta superfamily hydrolase